MKHLVVADEMHHLLARSESSQRQSATDGFRQANHVRLHAEIFAGAAPRQLRTGFYFVEDQQRAVFGGDVAQTLQKALLRHAQADVHQNRLENDGSDLSRLCKLLKLATRTFARLAFGTPPPPGTEFGASASPQSSALGFTLTSAASCSP